MVERLRFKGVWGVQGIRGLGRRRLGIKLREV